MNSAVCIASYEMMCLLNLESIEAQEKSLVLGLFNPLTSKRSSLVVGRQDLSRPGDLLAAAEGVVHHGVEVKKDEEIEHEARVLLLRFLYSALSAEVQFDREQSLLRITVLSQFQGITFDRPYVYSKEPFKDFQAAVAILLGYQLEDRVALINVTTPFGASRQIIGSARCDHCSGYCHHVNLVQQYHKQPSLFIKNKIAHLPKELFSNV